MTPLESKKTNHSYMSSFKNKNKTSIELISDPGPDGPYVMLQAQHIEFV